MNVSSNERVTDPVCEMTFRPEKAATSTLFDGRIYYFCSQACHRQFMEDPGKYTAPPGQSK